MELQSLGLRIGSEVIKHVVSQWLRIRKEQRDRDADLIDLLKVSVADVYTRRRISRQFEEIADHVADRLGPLYEHEFGNVPQDERRAALSAVIDTLVAADLSDEALLAADADSRSLAKAMRASMPDIVRRSGLSEGATGLYDRLLDQCCLALVHVMQQLPEFAPRATSEQLARLTRLAQDVGEMLDRLPRTSLTAPEGTERDVPFRDAYLTTVSRKLDRLRLLGVDHQHNPETRVSVAYLSLTVTMDGARGVRRRDDRWFTDRAERDEQSGVQAEDALAAHKRTLLLGDAGLGKTTLLQWLAVHSARGSFTGPLAGWNGRVPFLIRLREHPEGSLPAPEGFLSGVAATDVDLMPKGWVHRQLADHGLLLVDGVDEVARERRAKVRDWLQDLVDKFPELPIVVTSRPPAVRKTWLRELGFGPVLLESMGPAEVTEFVHRWHGSVRELARENSSSESSYSVDELDNYETAMLRHLDAAPHLRSLATTPLMCALLCAVNLNRHQHLPQDRMELYEVAVTMLAHRRDDERGVRHTLNLPLKAKLAALSDLAWWMTRNGRVEATRAGAAGRATHVLEQIPDVSIEADAALEYLVERSGIIQAPAEDRIDFVHRSFQEYLAAREAVDEDDIGMLIDNAHRDQWRETVVMAAGHAGRKQCAQLLTGLLDRADNESRHKRTLRLLAAACRETARKVDPDVSARIDAALDTVVPPRSSRETRSLASAGASVLSKLPRSLDGLSTAKAAACIQTAALINGEDGLRLLANYASDPRSSVQHALANSWRYFAAEEYAKGVLAEAPLDEGRIYVTHARHARWTPALRNLTELMVSVHHYGIDDLSFLDNAQHLTSLYCAPNKVVDLEPLRSHRELSHLIIGSVGVRSLEPLTDIALESLYLKLQGEPSSSRSIDRLASLRSLSLDNVGLADLTPISRLPSLSSLGLGDVGAIDLTPVSSLSTLTDLTLTDCDTDPTALVTALPVLDELQLSGGHPPDFAAMHELLSRLSQLDLVRQEFDPTHLARATNLRKLQLMDCPISDVAPLAGLTQLEDLDLDGTLVTDLSPLASLPRLTKIDVRNCPSELDLTPLSDLPQRATVVVSRGVEHRGLDSIRDRGHTIKLVA